MDAEAAAVLGLCIVMSSCLVAAVVAHWLRRIFRSLQGMGAIVEAGLNRAATNRGEPKISDDVNTTRIY